MFDIDLHVHTRLRSPCAETLDAERLPALLRAAGLHGLVVTEHDAMWTDEELARARSSLGPGERIYRGVEVTTRDGHYVVVGLPDATGLSPGMTPRALIALARGAGAAVILAHPHRGRSGPFEEVPPGVDALELFGGRADEARVLALARARGLGVVAGSDAHADEVVGAAYTAFPELPRDERELARLIAAGAGIARRRGARC
jgi:predicted metal-dependent phosphoesterase TrpH